MIQIHIFPNWSASCHSVSGLSRISTSHIICISNLFYFLSRWVKEPVMSVSL